jgi:DedD protein
MVRQVVSRSQRRMEKKQALILLVLVLGVSLASFSLGVMVGRSGSRAPAADSAAAPVRLPVAQKTPDAPGDSADGASGSEKPAEKLTFYDTLPKGDQSPLGSGINLPPKKEEPKPEPQEARRQEPVVPAATAHASAAPHSEATAKTVPAVIPAPPAVTAGGSLVVQVASFKTPEDAGSLKDRLTKKGFGAYIQKADLGAKGTWYRVLVGPYDDADAAAKTAERLKAEYHLSALVRKR